MGALSVYREFLKQNIAADLITYSALEIEDDSYYSIKYLKQGLVNFLKGSMLHVEYAKKSVERNKDIDRLDREISNIDVRIQELYGEQKTVFEKYGVLPGLLATV